MGNDFVGVGLIVAFAMTARSVTRLGGRRRRCRGRLVVRLRSRLIVWLWCRLVVWLWCRLIARHWLLLPRHRSSVSRQLRRRRRRRGLWNRHPLRHNRRRGLKLRLSLILRLILWLRLPLPRLRVD